MLKIVYAENSEHFYEKTGNNFLNSEQRIIYTEKRVNNFVNNAE